MFAGTKEEKEHDLMSFIFTPITLYECYTSTISCNIKEDTFKKETCISELSHFILAF